MKPAKLLILILAICGLLLFSTACGSPSAAEDGDSEHMDDDDHQDGDQGDEHMDDMAHMHVDPPEEFAELENPFDDDHEATEAGEEIFQTNCAVCHGPEGKGDGPGATGLDPQPADLSDGTMLGSLSDGYLFWRVSKGGAFDPFNSAMPAWETTLSEDQRWQVISFVRSLSGESGEHMDDHMDDDDHDDD